MNSALDHGYLIICSNDRANELAAVLSSSSSVFRRREIEGRWVTAEWKNGAWHGVEEAKIPTEFAGLFFHTGENDPAGIPANICFAREFAFSGGGLSPNAAPAGRNAAIPIQRRFVVGGCPVKLRHLQELEDFIAGHRTEPPAFCRHGETVPALWALAILCKSYAAISIASGQIDRQHKLVQALTWQGTEWETISRNYRGLDRFWSSVQTLEWWQTHLGFCKPSGQSVDETKYREFLSRLIFDLELDVLARRGVEIGPANELTDAASYALFQFLEAQPSQVGAINIVRLLKATAITPEIVMTAYLDISALLAQR